MQQWWKDNESGGSYSGKYISAELESPLPGFQ